MTPENAVLTYVQDPDDAQDPPRNLQELRVEAVDAGAGHYLVISTERWAIDPEGLEAFVSALRYALSLVEKEPS